MSENPFKIPAADLDGGPQHGRNTHQNPAASLPDIPGVIDPFLNEDLAFVAEQDEQIHTHLRLRVADETQTEYEGIPLGRFPVVALAAMEDETGHQFLNIDVTGMTPGEARNFLALAINSLDAGINEGHLNPNAQPQPETV